MFKASTQTSRTVRSGWVTATGRSKKKETFPVGLPLPIAVAVLGRVSEQLGGKEGFWKRGERKGD